MIGGWRWTAHARRRHYFKGNYGETVHSLCGQHLARLNGMEKFVLGPDDCTVCTKKLTKLTKGDRTLLP